MISAANCIYAIRLIYYGVNYYYCHRRGWVAQYSIETRTDVDIDDPDDASPIMRALGPDWRWKFMLIVAGALLATLLLIWLAKRAGRGGGVAAGGRPSRSPRSRCARCARTTSSRVRTRSRCPAATRTTDAASRWPSTTTPGAQFAGRPFRLRTQQPDHAHAMHGTVYTHSPKNLALISKQILFVCSSSSQTARVHFMPADHAQRTGFYRVVLPSLMRTLWLQAHNLSDDQIDLPFLFL